MIKNLCSFRKLSPYVLVLVRKTQFDIYDNRFDFYSGMYEMVDLVLQDGWCGAIKIIVRDVFSSTLFAGG